MKLKLLYLAALTASVAAVSSCSYNIYQASALAANYEASLTSETMKECDRYVRIFTSESEVPEPFAVLSYMEWHPVIVFPIIAPAKKQYTRNFYAKAVSKAYELGGNGVIVTSVGKVKVITYGNKGGDVDFSIPFADNSIKEFSATRKAAYVQGLKEQIENEIITATDDAEFKKAEYDIDLYRDYLALTSAKTAKAVANTYNEKLNYRHVVVNNDGDLSSLSKVQKKLYVGKLKLEIEKDLKGSIKTLDQVNNLRDKVALYQKCFSYNMKEPTKDISEYKETLDKLEKKIKRRASR